MRFGSEYLSVFESGTAEITRNGTASIDTCFALMSIGIDPRNIALAEEIATAVIKQKESVQ